MTVPSTARRAGPYTGNGSTTTFSFSFKTFAAADLQVTRTSATGIETVLVLNSHYSVSLNVDQDASPGGTITYPISGAALASGEKLTIVGNLAYEQTTDLLGGGAFNAKVIEDTFDRTVIQIQQLEERADRALALPVSVASVSTTLPVPAANKVIGWDSTASALRNIDPATLATAVAYANWRTDVFSGTGSATQFTLTADPGNVNNMDVAIGGVVQTPTTDFTVSGTTLTFASAPPAGTSNIVVRYGQAVPVGTADASMVTFLQAGTNAVARTAQSKLRDVVSVKDFGAVGDGITDDAAALIAAFAAAAGKTLVFENKTYAVGQLIATGNSVAIIGNNATIKYTANVNEPSLDLTDCFVQDITFDGSGFSIGKNTSGVKDSGVIKAQGESFRMVNVTFKNLHGLQNNYQYGAVVNAATRSLVSNCKFIEIKTRTDSTNTGGFCGGYMINAAQGVPMTPSTHLIENCLFQDIYTTRNNLGQLYDDSDGVRCYFYDIGTGVPGYDAAVRATTITVNNCSFVNVLKSACKLQDCNSYINDCRVVVNDLKSEGQTSVYTGFRYQQGNYVSLSNCSVVGPFRLGALLVGDNSFCNNFYFGAQNIVGHDQYGLTIGRVAGTFDPTASTIDYCGVTNFTCSGTDYSLDIYGCDEVFADGCKLEGPIAVIHCDQLFVTNSTLTGMIQNAHRSPYFPYLKKVIFDNCYINNNTTGFYQNNILSADPIEFVVENTKLENAREQFIETSQTINIKISNCNLMVNDPSNSGRKLLELVSVAKLRIYDTTITDTRTTTSPAQMIITGANTEFVDVDGLVFNAKTASNYTNAVYMAPGGANPVLSNIVFNDLPSGCTAIDIRNTTNPALSNIRCNYANANLNFFGGSNAIVNMFYGTLRATPNHITTGGGVVLHEYNTTFL